MPAQIDLAKLTILASAPASSAVSLGRLFFLFFSMTLSSEHSGEADIMWQVCAG